MIKVGESWRGCVQKAERSNGEQVSKNWLLDLGKGKES